MKAFICLSSAFLILASLGCATGGGGGDSGSKGGGGGKWSQNFALEEFGAKATDPRMNDGNVNTFAMTVYYQAESRAKAAQEASDKYTEATVTLPKAREINRILVIGEGLEKFEVEAHSDGGWKVIKAIKNNKKNEYAFNTTITADAVRVKIPREYESREIGGQRRGRARMGGAQATTGVIGQKKIYEIQLYAKASASETTSKVETK